MQIITNYPDYRITREGIVISLKRNKEKVLKQHKDTNGYLQAKLNNTEISRSLCIHRLVAQAFIPNPLNLPQVNHIDGNKLNNNDWNLEWCTGRDNCNHKFKNKKITSKYPGVSFDKANNKWRANIQVKGIIKNLGRYLSEEDAHKAYQNHLKLINHE